MKPGIPMKVQVCIRLPMDLTKQLKVHCARMGIPYSVYVETALREKLPQT
ncbi:MAG: hypothetical protein OHK0012_26020 [Synechococcales cyanobacterium]